ncbi:MAG: hypothetical protein NT005_13430 [Spirochaetes bacterium]|nr:hypothetical protein [Spirochaetota bacterium]
MREENYKGYVIRLKDNIVRGPHAKAGQWASGEYSIGKHTGEAYTEKPFVHEGEFFDSEAESQTRTLQLAKHTIDEDLVGF